MKSLRTQLTVRLLIGGALLLAAAGAALDWQMRRALAADFDAALHAAAQYLATYTDHKLAGLKVESEGADLPPYGQPDGSDVFLLRTIKGDEVQRSLSLGKATLPWRAGAKELFDAPLPDGRVLRCAELRFLPDMAKKAREVNRPALEVVLTVGRDRAPLDRNFAALRAALLICGTGALAGLIVIVRAGVRGGLAPLDRLGEKIAAVDAGSLATRFPSGPLPAELRPIAERLNELLARLEAAFAREQRFTATAAHELRTPLAELRALAEVNLTTPTSAEEHAHSWRDTLAITLRMERLALCLLDLTRAENPSTALRREPVALCGAIEEAWRPWARDGRALVNEVPGWTVPTDPALLAIVLGNLCANAAAHAPAGEPLRIGAERGNSSVTLRFRNRAEGLAPDDIAHLFERFWQKDDARANGRHHGLGLALAADFAALLGGGLTARLAEGDIEFALRLPTE